MAPLSDQPPSSSPIKVLVVGLSYGGVAATVNLLDLGDGLTPRQAREPYVHHQDAPRIPLEITIVDERDGYYHVIGTPLAFADGAYAKKAWVRFGEIPALQRPEVKFVHGSVASVDPATKRALITQHSTLTVMEEAYDFLIVASGLRRAYPVVPQSLTRKRYLLEAEEQIHAFSNAQHGVVVVGGGAVGIEMAAELKLAQPHVDVTLVHSRARLMSAEALPDSCKDTALELLRDQGVNVLLNHRLATTTDVSGASTGPGSSGTKRKYELLFENGATLLASEVVVAVSKSTPSTAFLPTDALDEEGYVKVHPNLQFASSTLANAADHFAVGDAALWSGIKRCGAAMHMGYYAAVNLHQHLLRNLVQNHTPVFLELAPVPPMIALAVGKTAVACGPDVGTISGQDVMAAYFRDDLGFGICWNYMQMGVKKDNTVSA